MKGKKIRSTGDMIKFALGFKLKDFLPEIPDISELPQKEQWAKIVILW